MNQHISKQQEAELDFWKNLYLDLGEKGFRELRQEDYETKTTMFEEHLCTEHGLGLDLGCGPVSIFEFSPLRHKCIIFATDPLMEKYQKITPMLSIHNANGSGLRYVINKEDKPAELIPFTDNYFNWVACINVLDHTQSPQLLIHEIQRVLERGGRLYLQVNFDPKLTTPHYELFDLPTIRFYTRNLVKKEEHITVGEYDGQELFWGFYVNA